MMDDVAYKVGQRCALIKLGFRIAPGTPKDQIPVGGVISYHLASDIHRAGMPPEEAAEKARQHYQSYLESHPEASKGVDIDKIIREQTGPNPPPVSIGNRL